MYDDDGPRFAVVVIREEKPHDEDRAAVEKWSTSSGSQKNSHEDARMMRFYFGVLFFQGDFHRDEINKA